MKTIALVATLALGPTAIAYGCTSSDDHEAGDTTGMSSDGGDAISTGGSAGEGMMANADASSPAGDDGGGTSEAGTGGDAGAAASGGSTATGGTSGMSSGGGTGGTSATSGDATATVDFTVTVGDHTGKIEKCSWSDGSAIAMKMSDVADGNHVATLTCKAREEGSFTAEFIVGLFYFSFAVGQHDAEDVNFACGATPDGLGACDADSVGSVTITYQDGAKAIQMGADSTRDGTKSGSFDIDELDEDTGVTSGSLDFTMTQGDVEATVSGTYSADLFDCARTVVCDGRPPQ